MSTVLICLLPILYSLLLLWVGFYVGRNGVPVRWVGFRRRAGGGAPTRVVKEFE
jgi:hypothetical protein